MVGLLPLNKAVNKLNLFNVTAGYGKKKILHKVSFSVKAGSIVALLGPNGSGKSTVLKTIFGLVKATEGLIEFCGNSCLGATPFELIDRGLVYVPQGNKVFPDLTVRNNITVSLQNLKSEEVEKRLEEIEKLFPALQKKLSLVARNLSGGERQQVALAMALVKRPQMLLLDEPSLGLAPAVLGNVFHQLKNINDLYGITVLIVEHKVNEVFKIADWALGLRRGEIIQDGIPDSFDSMCLKNLFLG